MPTKIKPGDIHWVFLGACQFQFIDEKSMVTHTSMLLYNYPQPTTLEINLWHLADMLSWVDQWSQKNCNLGTNMLVA